jgi:hypothetical protein
MIGFTAQRLMEREGGEVTGAVPSEHFPDGLVRCKG